MTRSAIVIGAGFGGMYALHRTRGMGLDAHLIEAGDDVGNVAERDDADGDMHGSALRTGQQAHGVKGAPET